MVREGWKSSVTGRIDDRFLLGEKAEIETFQKIRLQAS